MPTTTRLGRSHMSAAEPRTRGSRNGLAIDPTEVGLFGATDQDKRAVHSQLLDQRVAVRANLAAARYSHEEGTVAFEPSRVHEWHAGDTAAAAAKVGAKCSPWEGPPLASATAAADAAATEGGVFA